MAHLPMSSVSIDINQKDEFKLNDPLAVIMSIFRFFEASGFTSGLFWAILSVGYSRLFMVRAHSGSFC